MLTQSSTCSWTIGLSVPCGILKVYHSEHLHLQLQKIRGRTDGSIAQRRMILEHSYSKLYEQNSFLVLLFPDSQVLTMFLYLHLLYHQSYYNDVSNQQDATTFSLSVFLLIF